MYRKWCRIFDANCRAGEHPETAGGIQKQQASIQKQQVSIHYIYNRNPSCLLLRSERSKEELIAKVQELALQCTREEKYPTARNAVQNLMSFEKYAPKSLVEMLPKKDISLQDKLTSTSQFMHDLGCR